MLQKQASPVRYLPGPYMTAFIKTYRLELSDAKLVDLVIRFFSDAKLPAPLSPGLLMTAFIKIYLLEPSNAKLRELVISLFTRHQSLMDAELQQRASEYLVCVRACLNVRLCLNVCMPECSR